jgi:putative transposase
MGFIDTLREQEHAVESICRVLSEQGCQVAARTHRCWRHQEVAARTLSDAQVLDKVRDLAWAVDDKGRRKLTPEGLYGRRKMTALVRRSMAQASPGSVDRAMRTLGLWGIRRAKGVRTTIPAKDGKRAGDLLDRDFTAPAPNTVWVTDFTYCRTWAGFVYVAFIVDCFAQKIVAWHAATAKDTDLVMTPMRMALWHRDREGAPMRPGELICHSDAGSQYTSIRFTAHLELEDIKPSIGSVGDAYDNALMECVIGLFKTECIRTNVFHDQPYRTIADIEFATAGWVDWSRYAGDRGVSELDFSAGRGRSWREGCCVRSQPGSRRATRWWAGAASGSRAAGRVPRDGRRPGPAEHGLGDGVRPEGVLRGRCRGARGRRHRGCAGLHPGAAEAAKRGHRCPDRGRRGGPVLTDDQAAAGQHLGAV